jgi:hypothetical protein
MIQAGIANLKVRATWFKYVARAFRPASHRAKRDPTGALAGVPPRDASHPEGPTGAEGEGSHRPQAGATRALARVPPL